MVAETVVAVPVVAEIGGEEMKTVEDTSHHFHVLGKLTRGDLLLTIGLTGTGHNHLGLTGAMGHSSLGLLPLGLGHGSLGPRHPAHIQQQPSPLISTSKAYLGLGLHRPTWQPQHRRPKTLMLQLIFKQLCTRSPLFPRMINGTWTPELHLT